MKQINQPLANIVSRCIENSPDSEIKQREVQKLKDMFRDNNKRVWDVANRITFDRNRERKVYIEGKSKMLDCDRKQADLKERRKLEQECGWDL